MSLKHSLTRIVALTATLLAACGDEVTEVTEVHESGMKIVEEGEKLPECTTENEGTMVYALDSAAAYACVNREWTSFNGKDGEKGDKGDKGNPGDQGEQGEKGDKGDDGEKGAPGDSGVAGTSCTVEQLPDSSGFKVICGGDSVGVVLNGEKGEQGDKGEDGNDGKDGQDGKSIEGAENFFIDARDKQIYKKVTIGTQTWMAENLNFETDGSRCYNDSAKYCAKYGRYYTWADAMDSAAVFSDNAKGCGYDVECTIKTPARGICPEGWHIPTGDEWRALYSAMDESPYAMQAKGFDGWPDATDAYGFSALPAGGYMRSAFYDVGGYARFWGATEFTEYNNYTADYWYLRADGATCGLADENFALSVRCIKDSE